MLAKLIEKVAATDFGLQTARQEGRAIPPPPEIVGIIVTMDRNAHGLKQEALASIAEVSLSSIERIESGKPVSASTLEKVGKALGRQAGEFTRPRIPSGPEEAAKLIEEWVEPFEGTTQVTVAPLQSVNQVAKLVRTHLFLFGDHLLEGKFSEDVAAFKEWIEAASFIIGNDEDSADRTRPRVKRREIYRKVLEAAKHLERVSNSVILAGQYDPKTNSPELDRITMAIFSIYPPGKFPAARSRSVLFAPEVVDIAAAWKNFAAED